MLVLLLANSCISFIFIWRRCLSRDGLEINHFMTFNIGFVFYWLLPWIIGLLGAYRESASMQLWYAVFDRISGTNLFLYALIALGVNLCFNLSAAVGTRIFSVKLARPRRIIFSRHFLWAYFSIGLVVAGLLAYLLRSELFSGYRNWQQMAGLGWRGTMTAVSVFLLSIAFINSVRIQELSHTSLSFWQAVRTPYFVIYGVVALLVLSLGGRLYFISSLFMLLAYRTIFFQRVRLRVFGIFLAGVSVFSGILGLIRIGIDVGRDSVLLNLLLEPLYTSFSAIHFLSEGSFPVFRWPIFLLSDFINLVPTIILPNKAELLLSPEKFGFVLFSPGGAQHSFFSFVVNFGWLGTLFAFAFIGMSLSWLKSRRESLLPAVMYVMITGWLVFTFFRDPFSVSIVKNIFEFSILIPIIIVTSLGLLTLPGRYPSLFMDSIQYTSARYKGKIA